LEEDDSQSLVDILEKIYFELNSLDKKRTKQVLKVEAKPNKGIE
jgi:hypothetical protein